METNLEYMEKKLVIEALSLNYGKAFGFQEYLFNLLRYIKQHRNDVNVGKIILACKECDKHAFECFQPEIDIKAFKIKNTLHKYFILNTLYWKMGLFKEDVILFTNNYSSMMKKCKYLLVIHDLLYLRKEYMPNIAFRIQRSVFVPHSVRIADYVIGISEWVKKDIIDSFNIKSKEKVVAIYNFFDFEKFKKEPDSAIIDSVDGKNYFLVVCSSDVHKNTVTTLQAYKKYVENGGDKDLVIIGRLSNKLSLFVESLEKHIKSKIINLNGISNGSLRYLYQNASAYISATLFEGLGMPIVEAMYFGLPCIVSDIEVVKEVTAGRAMYFNALDVDELANCMKLVDTHKRLQQIGIIEDMYSEKNTVRKYVGLVNEIITEERSKPRTLEL